MLESYLTGLIVCGGIIVAIGAQNAYLLSQAIRQEHHWWSAGLCIVADITLFTLGMFGISAALMAMPEALEILRWLGVAFLGWLAIQSFVRASRGRAALEAGEVTKRSLKAVVFTTLAVTLLNPQVYLDTLLLIPAIGAQQEDATTFVAGASSASILWFGLLAWGGSALAPILSRPLAWRIIDGVIGIMMAAIALHLTFSGL
ncbi:L-lysine exporter family protein LysE/ArgO [Marinobacter sp. DSM 26671]|uniref:LysE/ArgO family amino acid transporter n=1 Tax=unclassified Marinobacter TaxID=83889 RepID=UPI0008E3346D|nr:MULTISPECIES: LysE/ArgO family amino acid transporter [unclassified Marinobacter]MCP4063805.1 amino acid transporter [Gammaproteobacteria bacterium]SFE00684.1 L-lysine exporter family protein LysE/ArgO [Marinobacter sp. DSM 26671]